MSNPQDYIVGWICAISTEYVAAQSFLDQKHDGPKYISLNDNNDYTLGKIGRHSVVIAVLPDGEYGIASAASVARDMLHRFPNIRIGLMVGIGGGAPSQRHDIRLGDVVVSAARDGNGGVFQYDFGKTIQDQVFKTTGFLNLPPMVLRTAVNGVKAQYESDGHQIEDAINNILTKKPRLRKKYMRPDQSSDILYRSGIIHPSDDRSSSCIAICGNNPWNLIPRPKRDEYEDNPAIHYGLIASANQLIKDATVRDRLAEDKDVLCFEMEAAGLMNHFPCLVIRGICDYSDSHKNTLWQGYAAMAAAAYAKDLLSRIPPNKIEAEKKIGDILCGVQEGVEKLLHRQHDQQHEAILNWLTPVNYAPLQMDYIGTRQPGTGQWFLNSAEYQAWLQADSQTLFCPGIPGAGKTIITAIVIDDLYAKFQNDTSVGIAYLYCDFRRQHEQKIEDLLLNLLKQLTEKQDSMPEKVQGLYKEYKKQPKRPPLDDILSVLYSVSTLYSRVMFIIDALDECQADGCLTRLLTEIFELQAKKGANIFSTARFIPDILETFKESLSLQIRAQDEDVQRYIANHIARLPSFVLNDADLQSKVKATVSKAVDGMFLLAPLHIEALAREPTVGHIELALQSLPRGIDEVYERVMIRIESQGGRSQDLAKKILSWITHAKRVLSITELQHAVAIEPGKSELNRKFIPSLEIIGTICAGLVTIDTQSNAVRLVHYTTQAYFERTREKWFINAKSNITTACVTYLSFSAFESGFCQTEAKFRRRLQSHPLYDYAAKNWGHHAREASTRNQSVMEFLKYDAKVEASNQGLMVTQHMMTPWSQICPEHVTGLHLAVYFEIEEVVKALLASHNPDVRDSCGQTALSYAAKSGHEAVVRLLLAIDGVNVNSEDSYGQTPLYLAAQNGREAVVRLLLAIDGVNINSKDSYRRTPLIIVAKSGEEAVVRLLLATNRVNVNSKDYTGRTALSWAIKLKHEAIVKLLVENGADKRVLRRR